MKIFVLDNYDSFTYILVQYLGELGVELEVAMNDEITFNEIEALDPDAILVSPGPGRPENAGISVELIKRFSGAKPILGVCLGHQALVEAFGGKTVAAKRLMHGKTCQVEHDSTQLFEGIRSPTECMRYHSLIADPTNVPRQLRVTAWTEDVEREVMAVSHVEHLTTGVQFHPESIGTGAGKKMLENFVKLVPASTVR